MISNGDRPAPTARHSKPFLFLIALTLALYASASAQTGVAICGELANSFGPFDYRKHAGSPDFMKNPNNPLRLVHSAHFRPEMEALVVGGQGPNSPVGPELAYTLRAFPNHHKALDAMVRLAEKEGKDPPTRAGYPVECWFDRALRFQPDDVIVRLIYATYLGKKNRLSDSLEQLKFAARDAKDNAFTHYNLGLIYFDLKQFDLAMAQARIAYGLGMQWPQLRDELTRSGHWSEPDAAAPPVAEHTSAAPASK